MTTTQTPARPTYTVENLLAWLDAGDLDLPDCVLRLLRQDGGQLADDAPEAHVNAFLGYVMTRLAAGLPTLPLVDAFYAKATA